MKISEVGWIGLGKMGVPMAANLLKAGFTVRGFDVHAEIGRDLQQDPGFSRAPSGVAAAQGAHAIVLMLPDSGIVDELLWGRGGLAAAAATGSLVIDMGSSDPSRSRANAVRLAEKGVRFVDAPVSGGVKRAVAAELSIIAGGQAADIDEARPVLQALGKSIVHVGDAGAGHAVKALNNFVSAAGLIAVSEALVAAQRFGLDPYVVNRAFNASSGRNTASESKAESSMLSGTYDYGFALGLMRKDVQTAAALIEAMGIQPAFVESVLGVAAAADEALGAHADHTAVHAYIAGLRRP